MSAVGNTNLDSSSTQSISGAQCSVRTVLFASSVFIAITSFVCLMLSLYVTESALFNMTTMYAFAITMNLGLFLAVASYRKAPPSLPITPRSISSIPQENISSIPLEHTQEQQQIIPAVIGSPVPTRTPDQIQTLLSNYLNHRKDNFSKVKINGDFDFYAHTSLAAICKIFSINPLKVTDEDVNLIFLSFAIQFFLEAKPVPACGANPCSLSISSKIEDDAAIVLKNPVTVEKISNNSKEKVPCYTEEHFGVLGKKFVKRSIGKDEFTLEEVLKETQNIPLDILLKKLSRDATSCLKLRLMAFHFHSLYWDSFIHSLGQPTLSQLFEKELTMAFEKAVNGYFLFEQAHLTMGYAPHINLIALLNFINHAKYVATTNSLLFLNGQKISFSDTISSFECQQSTADGPVIEVVKLPSTPHFLSSTDSNIWTNTTSTESIELKKILLKNSPEFIKDLKILILYDELKQSSVLNAASQNEKAAFQSLKCPQAGADHKEAIRLLTRLSRIVTPTQQTNALGAARKYLTDNQRAKKFNSRVDYLNYFNKFFKLNPPGREGTMVCFPEACSFYLNSGDLQKYVKCLHADQLALQDYRRSIPKTSPLYVSETIGHHLENTLEMYDYTVHVGPHDGDWIKCAPGATEMDKLKKIKEHARLISAQRAWCGRPEILIFAKLFKIQIHFYHGTEFNNFSLKVDNEGRPIPDEFIGEAQPNKPPMVLIFTVDHYTCGWPR